jgi:hypothetical protein
VSNLSPFSRRGRIAPAIPHGDVLGTYETYLEAQSVIDRLSKADFEITGLVIVGNNLTSVEQVTGKLTYGRTAIAGAARGAWFGLFIGLMFFIFSPVPVIGYIAAAAFIGAGVSMVFSVTMYTLGRRARDFTSSNHVLARSYDIIISPQLALRARTLLAQPVPNVAAVAADAADAGAGPAQPKSFFSAKPPKDAKPTKPAKPAKPSKPAKGVKASDPTAPVSSQVVAPGGAASASGELPGAELPVAEAPVAVVAAPRARPAYGELAPEVPAEVAVADGAEVEPAAAAAAAVKPAPKPRVKRVPKPPVDPAAKD